MTRNESQEMSYSWTRKYINFHENLQYTCNVLKKSFSVSNIYGF